MKFDEFWKKIAIISFITILVVLKLSVKKSPAPARPRSNLVIPGPGPGKKLAPGRSRDQHLIFASGRVHDVRGERDLPSMSLRLDAVRPRSFIPVQNRESIGSVPEIPL